MTARPVQAVFVPLSPRGLSRELAAAYCGCESLSAFDDWVRRKIIPGPMRGTHRWDRKAIDLALDRLSGLENHDDALTIDQWERIHGKNGNKDDTPTLDEWMRRHGK